MSDINVSASVTLEDVFSGIAESGVEHDDVIESIVFYSDCLGDTDFTTELVRQLVTALIEDCYGHMSEAVTVESGVNDNGHIEDTQVSFLVLAKSLAEKDTEDIIRLFAETLNLKREKEESTEYAHKEEKRKCACCNHPSNYHKGYWGSGACMPACGCEGFEIKEEAPCECDHPWSVHPEELKFTCEHAVYGIECICTRFKMARA